MRSRQIITLLAAVALAWQPLLSAQLQVAESMVERQGQQVRQVRRSYLFGDSSLTYLYHLDPADGRLLAGKWGDFFFGLSHGSVNNGSWCTWNFLTVSARPGEGRPADLIRQKPPVKTGMSRFSGGQLAEWVWEGELSLRLMQFESMPEWLFGRLLLPAGDGVGEIGLGAWPGGAHWDSPGRERHLLCGGQDLNLTQAFQTVPFQPGQYNAVALYNRNYSERNGNFLVFSGAQTAVLTAQAGGLNKVQMNFVPVPGGREFVFALSYFRDADPQESVSRFLGEQAPNIMDVLSGINWTPGFDASAFARDWEIGQNVLRVLASSGGAGLAAEVEAGRQQLAELQDRFRRGVDDDDPGACSAAWQELEALRLQLGRAWLDTLK